MVCILCSVLCSPVQAGELPKRPNKALCWFYRTSEWIDHYLLQNVDTSYITLPEHTWRLALNTGMVGVNSRITAHYAPGAELDVLGRTTPSVDLGFNASYRGFGFGYSWDLLHAYARRLNFSFGSKFIGLDFSMQTSTNIRSGLRFAGAYHDLGEGNMYVTNANLSIWYALNAAHYSHQAAIKQSYIQKKTAGSLLLHLSYMSSMVALTDTLKSEYEGQTIPVLSTLMSGLTGMTTRQVAVGIGYGINYTPNHGKVLLHASAAAMLVTYTVNSTSYNLPDSMVALMPEGEPMFAMNPAYPVHVTGNMRAAVSWEICPWAHMSLWATGDNIRFRSAANKENVYYSLSNWNWKVQLTVGVRFGAGRKRVQQVLDAEEDYLIAEEKEILRKARWHRRDSALAAAAAEIRAENALTDSIYKAQMQDLKDEAKEAAGMSSKRKHRMRHTKLPKWITGYFYSPRYEKRN